MFFFVLCLPDPFSRKFLSIVGLCFSILLVVFRENYLDYSPNRLELAFLLRIANCIIRWPFSTKSCSWALPLTKMVLDGTYVTKVAFRASRHHPKGRALSCLQSLKSRNTRWFFPRAHLPFFLSCLHALLELLAKSLLILVTILGCKTTVLFFLSPTSQSCLRNILIN